MNPDTPAIRTRNLGYAYPGRAAVLQAIDLKIQTGEFLGILGPNGAGKSSLVQLLAGVVTPSVGDIEVFGRPLRAMRSCIGYVPQRPPQVAHLPVTVSALVQLGCLQGWGSWRRARSLDRQRARSAMMEMELTELAPRLLRELSGGELQRALLARALAANPALLLLDEPTAHIDPAVETRIWTLLRRMTPDRTVVVVSHDPALLRMHADRIALLNGRLRLIEPDALDAAALQWAYSRHPEIQPATMNSQELAG